MLPACESPGADGPPGSASEREASLLRSFSQIRSFATVEDPVLLGQALGVTIRMARDTPEYSEAYISDDPWVPNGQWSRRATPGGRREASVSLTPLASGLCITHRDLVDRFGRRTSIGPGRRDGWISDEVIALGGGSYYWTVVEDPGMTLYVGAEFLRASHSRCASYLHLTTVRTGTRGG
jgi:hypothetical protein